jgi:hypothetical protein
MAYFWLVNCKSQVITDRLENAIDEARNQGLMTMEEAKYAREELHYERKNSK